MKKTLLLSALALTGLAIPAAAKDSALYFKPQTVSYQYYMPHSSSWGDMNVVKYTYNADGSINTMEETGQKTIYTYNSDGVSTIQPDNTDAPTEYFDLQGVRVSNPEGGIFIRHQGSTSQKVLIK
ncbi:MAG: hypothetical protein K2N35_05280 [Muribaculaceae bacterium]|nr:hypothetical protein [Muribaculaceae bacterium]